LEGVSDDGELHNEAVIVRAKVDTIIDTPKILGTFAALSQ
jgi:hypothetical protein